MYCWDDIFRIGASGLTYHQLREYAHAYTHTHPHTHAYTPTHADTHTRTRIRFYTRCVLLGRFLSRQASGLTYHHLREYVALMNTPCTRVLSLTRTHLCTHAQAYARTHLCTHAQAYARTHLGTHAHAHARTRART